MDRNAVKLSGLTFITLFLNQKGEVTERKISSPFARLIIGFGMLEGGESPLSLDSWQIFGRFYR